MKNYFTRVLSFGFALSVMAASSFAADAKPKTRLYIVSGESCALYRLANKSWHPVSGHELPIGTKILGQAPPARADIVYARTFDATYIVSKRCLRETTEGDVGSLPPSPGGSSGGMDEAVDLSDTSSSAVTGTSTATAQSGATPNASAPNFKVYFDFNVINRPGIDNLSFENYHSFLLVEINPSPDLQFTFDVEPQPKYYELAYQLTKKLELRVGKIFIPFDDLTPHNIYGGRVNTSRLAINGVAFLPDLWTDLGAAIRYDVYDTSKFSLETDFYVVNGFGEGGTDPLGQSTYYPSFGDLSVASPDNNREKAFGARVHGILANNYGLGFSYYRDRWSNDNHDPAYVTMFGADAQIRFQKYEFRTGLIDMQVDFPTGAFTRGGFYAELGRIFGKMDRWKGLLRGGKIQYDSRVINAATDQTLIGGMIIYRPNSLQYSLEYSRDVQVNANKFSYGYAAATIIVAL